MAVHDDVRKYLDKKGGDWEALEHPETESATEEASAVGIDPDHVAKTLLIHLQSGYALAVIPGAHRIDKKKLQRATGDHHARLATEDEMADDFGSYPLGTLPPLPGLLGLPAYLDPLVKEQGTVIFPAGSHTDSVRIGAEALVGAETFTEQDLVEA